uniref:Uncharacterized protein n=1 Tax=Oryza meridionalis TaxID=40149 RepID=A0A0E0CTD1_9ORYZ
MVASCCCCCCMARRVQIELDEAGLLFFGSEAMPNINRWIGDGSPASLLKGSVVGIKNELGFLTYAMPPAGSFDSAASAITTNTSTDLLAAIAAAAAAASNNDKDKMKKTVDQEEEEEVTDQEDNKVKIGKTVDKEALPCQEEQLTEQEEEETPAPPPPEYYSEKYKSRAYASKKSKKKALEKARRAAVDAYLNQHTGSIMMLSTSSVSILKIKDSQDTCSSVLRSIVVFGRRFVCHPFQFNLIL